MRVINALENIRGSVELLEPALALESGSDSYRNALFDRKFSEIGDSLLVVRGSALKTIAISSTTFIWLDRSKVSKSNIDASFGNIEAGKTVEVLPGANAENIAWVKIESL